MDEETWQTMIDVNLTGVWKTVRASVPHVVAGGRGGSVVITSSEPSTSSIGPSSISPTRILGPCRSARMAVCSPSSALTSRMVRINSTSKA